MGSLPGVLADPVDVLLEDLGSLDGRELAARLQLLEVLQRRVEHAIVEVVAEADRQGVWVEDGHRSVRGWCLATCKWSAAETTQRLRTIALLRDVESVNAKLAVGEIGVAQVRELARVRANRRCGDQLADAEEQLVQAATTLGFEEFRTVTRRWETLADADGAHRDHDDIHAGRNALLVRVGDEFHLDANGGTAQGSTMREIFDRFVEAEFHADWDDAHRRLGDDVSIADLARSDAQRRFDALFAIFCTAVSTPPDSRAPEPIVDIVVDQATFEAAVAAMTQDGDLGEVLSGDVDPTTRRCETIHGDPIDPCDAVTAALIGHLRRVVFGSASCVIDLGVSSRLFRGAARLAVWLQQGTRCLWPGCGLRHCQVDHRDPWSERPQTNAANGDPLCGHHNRWKTRGYRTWRDPTGHWHLHRPDGTEITPSDSTGRRHESRDDRTQNSLPSGSASTSQVTCSD